MQYQQSSNTAVLDIAHKHFGFTALRPGQSEAVSALLNHRDSMVIHHTGAGKSAIYQIAGVMLEGVTVIVSPLIALQKDQVDSINASDAPEAVQINSQRSANGNRETLERCKDGDFEYIFLAPEQLRKPETMEYLEAAGVSLFVVDEAHCIVEWGRDFRPDYLRIGPAIERLGHPVVLAPTATATPDVREEIASRLGMRNPALFLSGFDRPNIFLRVDHFKTEDEKLDAIVRRVGWADKPGIVYVATRKNAETIMKALAESGVDALFYHAGLSRKDREAVQNRFMDGDAEVMVATNAFGMGIDKADIRFVYHYDICPSLDAYYQEVGRAGRDDEKSEAILFYRRENIGSQKFRTAQGKLGVAEIEAVAQAVAQHDGPLPVESLIESVPLPGRKVEAAVQRLADSGALALQPNGAVAINGDVDISTAPQEVAAALEGDEASRRQKLEQMQQYAESKSCRRAILLHYFGEDFQPPCGNCDNCQTAAAAGTRREVV